jgi:hypothetical protein
MHHGQNSGPKLRHGHSVSGMWSEFQIYNSHEVNMKIRVFCDVASVTSQMTMILMELAASILRVDV